MKAFWSVFWHGIAAIAVGCSFAYFFLVPVHAETMTASWYSAGTQTANGERFNPRGMTAAPRTLPFGTKLRVCKSRCVVVRVNDRGPYVAGRSLDLAMGAAQAIGVGVSRVQVERLN